MPRCYQYIDPAGKPVNLSKLNEEIYQFVVDRFGEDEILAGNRCEQTVSFVAGAIGDKPTTEKLSEELQGMVEPEFYSMWFETLREFCVDRYTFRSWWQYK